MAYSYKTLRGSNTIRLLQILPGTGDAAVESRLVEQGTDDCLSYEALSYVWGDASETADLLVDGSPLSVSANLYLIIMQLRRPDFVRTLWIDAVCIDQRDSIERGTQVALMGQIYRQADTVLCWLGDASTHRTLALNFLHGLSHQAQKYINLEIGDLWSLFSDTLVEGADPEKAVASAVNAHVESIFGTPWFTRVWITQEVSLARDPVIVCGQDSLPWKDFETAIRILACCVEGKKASTTFPLSTNLVWALVHARSRYQRISRQDEAEPVVIELDVLWSLGRIAWESRHQCSKDDRDRVYAVLSLVCTGASHKMYHRYVPMPFKPDYTRSVEWAYGQFWSRFGGYSSLYFAGLSRRGSLASKELSQTYIGDGCFGFNETCLPSWCPDLRPNPHEWEPIFSSDYAASTPMHHMECHFGDVVNGPGPLMIRGHRIDAVSLGFHISREFAACKNFADAVDLRQIIKLLVTLQVGKEPYPSGQTWLDALGFALMTDMPSGPNESPHPFQPYTKQLLTHTQLIKIWHAYLADIIAETGRVWQIFHQISIASIEVQLFGPVTPGQKFQFDPSVHLTKDELLLWKFHEYMGDVLTRHRFIVTSSGWMGLAPPDTAPGDVVVVIGGPGTAFVLRDSSMEAMAEIVFSPLDQTEVVSSETGTPVSQLLGPCYMHGVMNGEMYAEEESRWKGMAEWEEDRIGKIPKQTIYIV